MQKRKQGFHEDFMLNALEILLEIDQEYPERMIIAVPDLLACLENISPKIRNKAYLILDSLVGTRTEFFLAAQKNWSGYSIVLSVDARIYGCSLIKNISIKNPAFVMDTYAVVEDLRLNHPDSRLRSEAGYAVEKLKPKEQPVNPISSQL